MRACFSDLERIKKRAKRNVETGATRLEHWFIQKYKLPASHALFRRRSQAELLTEMFEDLWRQKAEIESRLLEADAHERGKLITALGTLRQILEADREEEVEGFVPTGDPLADQWERDLLAGRDPDLDLGIEDLNDGEH